MEFKKEVTVSFPILGLMGLLFVALKLTHQIDWAWTWVLAPFWAIPAIALFLIVFALLAAGIALLTESKD